MLHRRVAKPLCSCRDERAHASHRGHDYELPGEPRAFVDVSGAVEGWMILTAAAMIEPESPAKDESPESSAKSAWQKSTRLTLFGIIWGRGGFLQRFEKSNL